MAKLPRFLIAQNEQTDPNSQYVVHTQEPAFIAKIVRTNSLELLDLQKKFPITVNGVKYDSIGTQTRVGDQLWAAFVIEFFQDPDMEAEAQGSGGLMSRLGDWMHNYIK